MKIIKSTGPLIDLFAGVLILGSLAACDAGVQFTGQTAVSALADPLSPSVEGAAGEQTGTAQADSLVFLQNIVETQGSYRLMSVGDSITHGRGNSSYRRELNKLLLAEGCPVVPVGSQSNSAIDTPHEGYSGHSTADFLIGRAANAGIAENINQYSPDIVLLHIGSVDLYRGSDVEEALAGIDQVIATIQSEKPGTYVLLANLIPWLDMERNAKLPVAVAQLGDRIEEYVAASGNPLLQLVDVRSGFSSAYFVEDHIHPNVDGDAHLADAFFEYVYSSTFCSK